MVIVDFLKNRPEHIETVSRWVYEEWTRVTVRDLEEELTRTRCMLNDDRIPLCLVACEGSECVGTASIYENDLASRPEITPWLAALYVRPTSRNQGVGSVLMERVLCVARDLGVRVLYLHTETAAEYYRKRGWRFLFRTVNDRNEITDVFELDVGR